MEPPPRLLRLDRQGSESQIEPEVFHLQKTEENMKLNAKALTWAGVLAIVFLVAGSLPAQAQSCTTTRTQCFVQFTNINGVCVTEDWELDIDSCPGMTTFTCTLVDKTKDPNPCPTVKAGDELCLELCSPV
jgi:hypothetical protein